MAIYRLEAKIIGREKKNRSVVAAAAYRAGSKLEGQREGKTHDYSRRSKGVMATTILTPEGAPEWATNPAVLWNSVESSEKRVDAQLAREFILALPVELTAEAQFDLAKSWARDQLVGSGMVAHIALHHSKDGANPHVHIMCPLRRLDGEKFAAKKAREWNDVTLLLKQRQTWADAVNEALERAGSAERVDHRSLKAQGRDQIPQPKMGVAATAMEKRGAVKDSKRRQEVRFVGTLNEVLPQMRSLQRSGEVKQMGVGASWWERSIIFAQRATATVRETVMDVWNQLRSRTGRDHSTPMGYAAPMRSTPDLER